MQAAFKGPEISIHALLAESDCSRLSQPSRPPAFLSTLSLRRATKVPQILGLASGISIHALLAESDRVRSYQRYFPPDISIHALLAESDPPTERTPPPFLISIHALLAESDRTKTVPVLRGPYFYPRSPCGERLKAPCTIIDPEIFLSTLSLRRATGILGRRLWYRQQFLSTLSLRRATTGGKIQHPGQVLISIHALLAESDRRRCSSHQIP